MPQKGLKREKRGTGRKEKNFPQNFFFCLPGQKKGRNAMFRPESQICD